MENIVSSKSKNKLKFFVLICGCLIAVTVYAIGSPLNLENTKINEISSTQTSPSDLAKAKNCFTCHLGGIGPAFDKVGKKYANDKTAFAKLTVKVMKGSSGTWGVKQMPPNAHVNKAEAQTLVKWILSLK